MTIGDGSRAGSASHLDSSSVLKNRANLRQACEFVIDRAPRRTDPAKAIIPGSVDAFIERLSEVRDGAIVYVKSTLLAPFFDRAFA
jgi:hypothetical protein